MTTFLYFPDEESNTVTVESNDFLEDQNLPHFIQYVEGGDVIIMSSKPPTEGDVETLFDIIRSFINVIKREANKQPHQKSKYLQ
jgi:hypothetical protein